jgi:hypothetical protein
LNRLYPFFVSKVAQSSGAKKILRKRLLPEPSTAGILSLPRISARSP